MVDVDGLTVTVVRKSLDLSNRLDPLGLETERIFSELRPATITIDEDFAPEKPRTQRWFFPTLMFVLTVFSTFWAGVTAWAPETIIASAWEQESAISIRQCLIANWQTGLIFSGALLGILLAHEMGHYVMTRIYRVESSYPIFIPFPFNPFGTCGALIMMDGRSADRRQIFDIGIAGPLAGLVVAIPLAIIGLKYQTQPEFAVTNGLRFGEPLLLQLLDYFMQTKTFGVSDGFSASAASPLLMAAWIGLLVTGINMMPISQLDGGHVVFGLLGKNSVWVARTAYFSSVAYLIYSNQPVFILMLILVWFIGLGHPPSRNDQRKIGSWRTVLAFISLTLPILCIPARPIIML